MRNKIKTVVIDAEKILGYILFGNGIVLCSQGAHTKGLISMCLGGLILSIRYEGKND